MNRQKTNQHKGIDGQALRAIIFINEIFFDFRLKLSIY